MKLTLPTAAQLILNASPPPKSSSDLLLLHLQALGHARISHLPRAKGPAEVAVLESIMLHGVISLVPLLHLPAAECWLSGEGVHRPKIQNNLLFIPY